MSVNIKTICKIINLYKIFLISFKKGCFLTEIHLKTVIMTQKILILLLLQIWNMKKKTILGQIKIITFCLFQLIQVICRCRLINLNINKT